MPKDKQKETIKLLADRLALCMTELANRDMDYGKWCFEEFYTDADSELTRHSKTYKVNLDFVRMMVKKHAAKSDATDAA